MTVSTDLIIGIISLYAIILLGYLAGKRCNVSKESIAALLIYFISPIVIFNGVATALPNASVILLPLLFFALATIISATFYLIGKFFWQGAERNVLAFTSGVGNVGYFGLPLIIVLFGEQYLPEAVLSILGFILYENSVGYYLVARGHFKPRDAFIKMCRLPSMYAFILGLLFLTLHLSIHESVSALFANFRGAYSILGMMLVGLGLVGVTANSLDIKFLSATFIAKFLVWPIAISSFILLDTHIFHIFASSVYPIMLVLSIVPLASNTVAFAAELNVVPGKAAIAVLASTIFALLYIPLFIATVFPLIL